VTREWSAAFAADLHLSAGDGEGLARAGGVSRRAPFGGSSCSATSSTLDSGDELRRSSRRFASFRRRRGGAARRLLAGNRDFNSHRARRRARRLGRIRGA
jgi:hypothetical protein